jgi:hypothetical protein
MIGTVIGIDRDPAVPAPTARAWAAGTKVAGQRLARSRTTRSADDTAARSATISSTPASSLAPIGRDDAMLQRDDRADPPRRRRRTPGAGFLELELPPPPRRWDAPQARHPPRLPRRRRRLRRGPAASSACSRHAGLEDVQVRAHVMPCRRVIPTAGCRSQFATSLRRPHLSEGDLLTATPCSPPPIADCDSRRGRRRLRSGTSDHG